MKNNKQRIKYISVKLPASITSYPFNDVGSRKLPDYTPEYLRKHGRKLFNILLSDVPSTLYGELINCIREKERF